ncbi:N-acetyltransferase [Burkholderia thailandensis]|uniref:GNAT family N-acetyltransferase n=1 Tax=Burkholderia humptydooensis TaxID=430531 RepID=UPI0005A47A21|nr:GNAT family N-acetyltransferase [Burkholderia humptydooensis]ATF34164.1 N-acetyltransferase [Burkholderia thailandensis]
MAQKITLRPASTADEPFLLRLRKRTMTDHLQKAGVPADDETHYERIRSNFEDAKVIRADDEDVGLLKVSRAVAEWHVHQLQISPDYQGRGIGKAVLGLVLEEAKDANVAVSLSVMHDNPARRLYERLGFKLVGETPRDVLLVWHPQAPS